MSTSLVTADQVRAIQTARRRHGLDETAYRAALAGFGVVSTKALTADQAGAFLDRLNGARSASGRPAHRRATGPWAKKLQALWISAWNLGVVRDGDDTALLAFAQRQAKVDHTRFLLDPKDAGLVIEAVKAMLVRDGGVVWPKREGRGAIELKRAIVVTQMERLRELGRCASDGSMPAETVWTVNHGSGPQLDALSKRLGVTLRRLLAEANQGA